MRLTIRAVIKSRPELPFTLAVCGFQFLYKLQALFVLNKIIFHEFIGNSV